MATINLVLAVLYSLAICRGLAHQGVTASSLDFDTNQICSPGTVEWKGKCLNCPAGTFSNIYSKSCQRCPSNTFSARTGSSKCDVCPPGKSVNELQTGCEGCPAGTFSVAGSPCIKCKPGTYSKEHSSVCERCEQNSIAHRPGSSACKLCGAGQEADKTRTKCVMCSVGKYSSDTGKCVPCVASTYSSTPGSTVCTRCPSTFYSSEGAAMCGECNVGTQVNKYQTDCDLCLPGTYSDNAGICKPCPFGTVSSNSGAAYCATCKKGTIPNSERTACIKEKPAIECGCGYEPTGFDGICKLCKVGYYSIGMGHGCVKCPKGLLAPYKGYCECIQPPKVL